MRISQIICIFARAFGTKADQQFIKHTIMTGLIGLLGVFVLALVGFAIAELKGRKDKYVVSEEEIEAEEHEKVFRGADEGKEKNIRDIMKENSTGGYSAV